MAVACRHAALPAMGDGLWKIRTRVPSRRPARVLICLFREHSVARLGFIRKSRTMPDADLALARKRQKELQR